jgi:hypothetical protein
LKNKRQEVAADKEDAVRSGLDAGDPFAVHDDGATKAEVDGCCEEGGTNGEADEVPVSVVSTYFEMMELN